jgi:hypothetical protein
MARVGGVSLVLAATEAAAEAFGAAMLFSPYFDRKESLHLLNLSILLWLGCRLFFHRPVAAAVFSAAAAAVPAAPAAGAAVAAAAAVACGRLEKNMHSPPRLFSTTSFAHNPA